MTGFTFNIRDTAGPALRRLIDGLGSSGRAMLNRAIGRAEQSLVRRHLIQLSLTRHATAERLGGTPTGHYGQAAEKVSQPSALSVDANSAFISVAQPGMSRAAHDVDIYPQEVKFLTIPLAAESYGNRIMKGTDSRFEGGFFFTSKNGNLLYGRKLEEVITVTDARGKERRQHKIQLLYLLREHVHQNQDRTLLPSDEQILRTAKTATGAYVAQLGRAVDQEISERTA